MYVFFNHWYFVFIKYDHEVRFLFYNQKVPITREDLEIKRLILIY